VRLAPNTATTHTITNNAAATLDVNARTATISSLSYSGTPQFIARFIGV